MAINTEKEIDKNLSIIHAGIMKEQPPKEIFEGMNTALGFDTFRKILPAVRASYLKMNRCHLDTLSELDTWKRKFEEEAKKRDPKSCQGCKSLDRLLSNREVQLKAIESHCKALEAKLIESDPKKYEDELGEIPDYYREWRVKRDVKGYIRLNRSWTNAVVPETGKAGKGRITEFLHIGPKWDPKKADQKIDAIYAKKPGVIWITSIFA